MDSKLEGADADADVVLGDELLADRIAAAVLRHDERCFFAQEATVYRAGGKTTGQRRLVALIVSRASPNQCAFFVFKQQKQTLVVKLAKPIWKDCKASLMLRDTTEVGSAKDKLIDDSLPDQFILKLDFQDGAVEFVEFGEEMLSRFTAEIKQFIAIADTENFDGKSGSHAWLAFYTKSPQEYLGLSESSREKNIDYMNDLYSNARNQDIFKKMVIQNQLHAREKEFTTYKKLTVFCGTWNVNGKNCQESLSSWLACAVEPDIYAIGFQELDLSAGAFLLDNSIREEEWSRLLEMGLPGPSRKTYRKVISKQLVGILLIVYVRNEHYRAIRDFTSDAIGTGVMGVMGNKGGVAVRMRIYDSYFVFVNSHLAAGYGELQRRNADFAEICRRASFQTNSSDQPKFRTIFDGDYVFWFGDLNYRVPLPDTDVKQQLEAGNIEMLLSYDQLSIERRAGKAFFGFDEGPINFVPSYKYDVGTDTFDTSEKRRAPSWCDRILWRRGDKVEQLHYKCHMEFRSSDHKPVSALFEVYKVKIFSQEKKNEVQQRLVRELDKQENDRMPDISLSANSVDFGDVRYQVPQSQTIELNNVGQVVAQFLFIPKNDDHAISKPWLIIDPPRDILLTGERKTITFTVSVDAKAARELSTGSEQLEDILILHLENGRDMFISVSGHFLPSVFGLPLETLVQLPGPVRTAKLDEAPSSAAQLSVPRECWRLVDYLYNNGLQSEEIFISSGVPEEMERIRESLDTGEEFSFNDSTTAVQSVANTLINFLESLPEPVVPYAFHDKCLEASQNSTLAKQVVSQFPTVHYNVFVYLTSFLREVIHQARSSDLSIDILATIFSAVMLPSVMIDDKSREITMTKKAQFLAQFLATTVTATPPSLPSQPRPSTNIN